MLYLSLNESGCNNKTRQTGEDGAASLGLYHPPPHVRKPVQPPTGGLQPNQCDVIRFKPDLPTILVTHSQLGGLPSPTTLHLLTVLLSRLVVGRRKTFPCLVNFMQIYY